MSVGLTIGFATVSRLLRTNALDAPRPSAAVACIEEVGECKSCRTRTSVVDARRPKRVATECRLSRSNVHSAKPVIMLAAIKGSSHQRQSPRPKDAINVNTHKKHVAGRGSGTSSSLPIKWAEGSAHLSLLNRRPALTIGGDGDGGDSGSAGTIQSAQQFINLHTIESESCLARLALSSARACVQSRASYARAREQSRQYTFVREKS